MNKFILFAVFCVPLSGLTQSVNDKFSSFVEYKNHNKVVIMLDRETFSDKDFTLKIPPAAIRFYRKIEGTFFQAIQYSDSAEIILLYSFRARYADNFKSEDLSFRKFGALCKREKIYEFLDDKYFLRRRHFGVYRLGDGKFYAIYVNVKRKNVEDFSHAISTIKLE